MNDRDPRCPYCSDLLTESLFCDSCGFAFERCSNCCTLVVAGTHKCPQCNRVIVLAEPALSDAHVSKSSADLPRWFDPLGLGSKLLMVYFILGAIAASIAAVFTYRARFRFIEEFGGAFSEFEITREAGYYYDMGFAIAVTALALFCVGAVSLIILRIQKGKRSGV